MIFFKGKNPLKGNPTKWYSKGEKACVHGRDIPNGLVYIGNELVPNNDSNSKVDACLIDPSLEATRPGIKGKAEYMGYWPYYSEISESCRGEYLDWLAAGCKDPNVNMGYVFLYFYGLERRLLVDSDAAEVSEERDEIIAEVIRLLSIYGESASFNRYANCLLVAEWLIFRKSKKPPTHIDINNARSSEPIKIELGLFADEDRPVPANVAFRWYVLHPEYKIRTPARRCADEFDELFKEEYQKVFGEGLYLSKAKKKLKFKLSVASPSIEGFAIKIDLPDCFDSTKPLTQIKKIVDKCTDKLEKYSRYLAKSNKASDTLHELSLLPNTIANKNPKAIEAKELLRGKCNDKLWFTKLQEVYQLINEPAPAEPSKNDLKDLFAFLQLLGFGAAPDVRYQNIKLGLNSDVAIFPCIGGENFEPSKEFNVLSSIIRLGAIMSRIDGHIHKQEVSVIRGLVDKAPALSELERKYVEGFFHWCFHAQEEDALSSSGIKPYLEKLPFKYRRHIADLMIRIIYADKQIKVEEIRKLEKFYPTLGLDITKIPDDIYRMHGEVNEINSSIATGPVSVSKADAHKGFRIPGQQIEEATKGVQLDPDKLARLIRETPMSQKVLGDAFKDNEEEEVIENRAPKEHSQSLPKLDADHRILLEHIIQKESWDRKELIVFCEGLRLMLDGALANINEWAAEISNAPLVEDNGEDLIYIDFEIVEEVNND